MEKPRAYTKEEATDLLLKQILATVEYWKRQDGDICDGVAFSILSILDGCACDMPAVDLIFCPHESDKKYNIEFGSNWFEPGTRISTMLHERYAALRGKDLNND